MALLLIAYKQDAAGYNMACSLAEQMEYDKNTGTFCGQYYDLAVIDTPAIHADWLDTKYDHDAFVFLSKHAAESGTLALTCHSTGNFSDALFGGNARQVAAAMPDLQKAYLQKLKSSSKSEFAGFEITIEATHHGPTALKKPSIFVEVGTTERQWTDTSLCRAVSGVLDSVLSAPVPAHPVAVAFGGTHYPKKFTDELLYGKHALGTVIPKRALPMIDDALFEHIMERNGTAKAALLDWNGMGAQKQKILNLLSGTDLEVIKL